LAAVWAGLLGAEVGAGAAAGEQALAATARIAIAFSEEVRNIRNLRLRGKARGKGLDFDLLSPYP